MKEYSKKILITLGFVSALVLVLDLSEVLRFTSTNQNIKPFEIVVMTISKCFNNMTNLLPFVVLVATIATFIVLGRKNEMMIFSTLGVSTRRILFNILLVISTLYIIFIFIGLPINSGLTGISNKIYIKIKRNNSDSNIYLAEGGIFFKNFSDRNFFIKSDKMNKTADTMFNVSAWEVDKDFILIRTITSDTAVIHDKKLFLKKPKIIEKNSEKELKEVQIDFNISPKNIIKSLGRPEQINIFRFPSFIKTLSECGFSTTQYEGYFYNKITTFFSLITMALIGFICSFHAITRLFNKRNIFYGIAVGIGIFFLNDFLVTVLLDQSYSISIAILVARLFPLSIVTAYVQTKYVE
jgi:lipopolysaccharide export LptBFGC system permease protein LptF